jgi:peptidoglycan-N-acetylglucosamine deacetylase
MIDNLIPWPDGARCAVATTWDMDADSGLNYYHPDSADRLVASQSLTRYGPLIAMPRIVKLYQRFNLHQTFFVPGWCAEQYPEAVELILKNDHELALHGYLHERPNELSDTDEQYWLERGIAAFVNRFGLRPRGWRAPSFAFSKYSLRYLIDRGFDYDSSLMGDDIPYLLQDASGALLELPTQWTLDDWPYYMHNRDFNYMMPISAPQRALEVYRSEFDAAWTYGGLWISVWHPFLSGRPARLAAIIDLLEYMQSKGNVWFARLDEICDYVKKLVADIAWQPRVEHLPPYHSPLPELPRRHG